MKDGKETSIRTEPLEGGREFAIDNPYSDGDDLLVSFGVSPFEALTITHSFLSDVKLLPGDEARAELQQAYDIANIVLGTSELTEREEVLASAFFALGLKIGKQVSTYPKLEKAIKEIDKTNRQRSQGGRHSPYKKHQNLIERHLEAYKKDRTITQADAIREISSATGMNVSPETFRGWWKRYKGNGSIFQTTE